MSDDGTTGAGMNGQPEHGFAPGDGVWQPLAPGGEYDADATMHVSFAERFHDLAATPSGTDPLAAPGHGYVPPQEAAGWAAPTDVTGPTGSGEWPMPFAPDAGQGAADPVATQQWTIPFADDPGDESGEYSVGQMVATPREPAHVALDEWPDQTTTEEAETGPVPAAVDAPAEPHTAPEAEAYTAPEAEAAPPAAEADPHSEHPVTSYVLRVNGADRPVTDAWLGESLLYVLRERLGLAGAKDGCEQGECGACSVQVDGRLVASCLMPAATAAGCDVRTVEGLARDGRLSDVQQALADCGAVQCGFCVPGLAMTLHDLLAGNHRPTELETRQALSGNLCRCSGYQGVLDAVRQVVAARAAADEDEESPAPAPENVTPLIPHQASGAADDGGLV
ncbi:(2Fe-2S)-binding protein [Streptomyces sp. RPT161]|uniref:(2Fe-2S)-binding protein n=1 Tax=Streptomyces sp. RPT161 TaxID=3015993 RepID=UPI0022B8A825|nr:2Fe-2S iron-sulfur cluster-binding protein [Streptomyces sp. RPT161]